jgi:1-acyl-sn-glycerol-3-phosphate acyltransferase
MMLTRRVMNWLGRHLAHAMMRLEISGMENVPMQGRQILMFNHINFVDAPACAFFWPREVEVMTKAENLRTLPLGPLFRLYRAFPIVRGEVDRRALEKAIEVLEQDKVLLMSPEGHRYGEHGLGQGRDGMALIAVRTRSPLIPVALWGQEKVMRSLFRLKRATVKMVVGKPFEFIYPPGGKADRSELTEMTTEAMYILSAMLPEEYRGAYADLSKATRNRVRPFEPEKVEAGVPVA